MIKSFTVIKNPKRIEFFLPYRYKLFPINGAETRPANSNILSITIYVNYWLITYQSTTATELDVNL